MAGEDGAYEGVEGDAVDTGGAGTVESDTGAVEQEAPARQFIEVDDPTSVWTKVKVNGEEVEVPLAEALAGYSRTADYTQKTQTLAEQQRQAAQALQLQQALERDPVRTLRALQEMYRQEEPAAPEIPQFDDPLEQRIWEQDQRLQQLQETIAQREADMQLRSALGSLQQQYGASEDDIRQVVATAHQHGYGIESFPMILQSLQYQRIRTNYEAWQQSQAQQAAQTQQRQAAAQQASALVSGGMGSAGGVTTEAPVGQYKSIREAAEAALEQFGLPT